LKVQPGWGQPGASFDLAAKAREMNFGKQLNKTPSPVGGVMTEAREGLVKWDKNNTPYKRQSLLT
jgi:hypothetical protein